MTFANVRLHDVQLAILEEQWMGGRIKIRIDPMTNQPARIYVGAKGFRESRVTARDHCRRKRAIWRAKR